EPPKPARKRYRRVTKKDIIVRTMKTQKTAGQPVSLRELSDLTGLTPHDLSGHLVHLINEGKIERLGRGLFALAMPPSEGKTSADEMRDLLKAKVTNSPVKLEEKLVITNDDHSESKRMMLDFLNDALLMCPDVELVIKCKKNEKGKGGQISVELKAH
ncbi:MAG: hypothetical protein OEV21_06195, partial [Thermoplasmata archaeon]|nr:hypothetical protein [Thermoplasmata archaeon]